MERTLRRFKHTSLKREELAKSPENRVYIPYMYKRTDNQYSENPKHPNNIKRYKNI